MTVGRNLPEWTWPERERRSVRPSNREFVYGFLIGFAVACILWGMVRISFPSFFIDQGDSRVR